MPGHVAQMQRLFQSAKASLRLDVRYAASPRGTIDSRLPSSPDDGSIGRIDSPVQSEKQGSETPSKEWRYSRAPRLLAELDVDVREPFPDTCPQLPNLLSINADHSTVAAVEPTSSGFASPVASPGSSSRGLNEAVSPLTPDLLISDDHAEEQDACSDTSAAALEGPMTELRVSAGDTPDVVLADESPVVNHLTRRSRDTIMHGKASPETKAITLSAPAKAAADSAKVKRGMLSNLFPKPPTHRGSDGEVSSPRSRKSKEPALTPCPDPLLHERGPVVLCPDPGLHYGSCTPNSFAYSTVTPSPNMQQHHLVGHQHAPHSGPPQPPLPFNRATATGSPMPMLKVKSPTVSPRGLRQRSHNAWHNAPHVSHRQHPRHHHQQPNQDYPSAHTEHIQPGWYHGRENAQTLRPPRIEIYSFSTAAAKVDGHDPAPDSMIRDSYRTDTLIPQVRPPTGYRKNGIAALANARGMGGFYGTPAYGPRPSSRPDRSRPMRLPESRRFRSTPPRSFADSIQPSHRRKRSREAETPAIDVMEDAEEKGKPLDPKLRLGEGEEVIEVDEETRAAVRMSLYGASVSEQSSDAPRGMTELSPNVVAWRRDTRHLGSRKKRRPSYWNGDLEEVVRSPAARRVVSSPVKKDDVRSQQAEVEFHEDAATGEVIEGDEVDSILGIAEGSTVPQDDVRMES